MSLRTRLRLGIVGSIGTVVAILSLVYLGGYLDLTFKSAFEQAQLVANQMKGPIFVEIGQAAARRRLPPDASLIDQERILMDVVAKDPEILSLLRGALANYGSLVEVFIAGRDGRILTATEPSRIGTTGWSERSYDEWQQMSRLERIIAMMVRHESFAITVPIGVQQQKLFTIVVVVSTLFVKDAVKDPISKLGVLFILFFLGAVFLSLLLTDWIMTPLERVSQKIDQIAAGAFTATGQNRPARESKEFADVQSKLNLLGQQVRGVRQNADELRNNVEQMLQRLEEGVLLFDPQGALMMAGHPVQRLLGRDPMPFLGRPVGDLFPGRTPLADAICEAVRGQHAIIDKVLPAEAPDAAVPNLLVRVEPLGGAQGTSQLGALVTLRDAETQRELESQLDVSQRLAAISRLTGGVAHEIKNPLNAIAVHLEVLRTKLDEPLPEIDVISREISRLDRVVRTFLDFNRPIHLQMRELDLDPLVRELGELVKPEAARRKVDIEVAAAGPARIRGDQDLLKQAILNVALNGVEAMQQGGRLRLELEHARHEWIVKVSDTGPGIPQEIQDKIFNLYFTTKERGSGIGLAMTFRVVQLHNGKLDFQTALGSGTCFQLRFPEVPQSFVSVYSAERSGTPEELSSAALEPN